jgi:hypothetical protein
MSTGWPSTDEIDTCNEDQIVEISKVAAGNKFLTENHLISC